MEPRRRFRFLKELSEGAFGKVYLAEMITGDNFKSVVAIKLLHGKWAGHEEIVQRSRDEARVLGLLHHKNIIRVEDLTSINGQCAIVMEYLDGVDLKSLVTHLRETGARFPRRVIFEVGAQIAGALEAAYEKPPLGASEPLYLIHRDIKPSNVMVTVAGDVKVLDFGTAQARFDHREAQTQALAFGSAAYMGPERLLGDPDAPSGDIFSLGVTLYELLALDGYGKIHIRPEKYDEKLQRRLAELDLSDLGPELAEQVRGVMRRLMAYEANERPTAADAGELLEQLAEAVNDGNMRRFCREVVQPVRASIQHPVDANDPLTGSTVVEDVVGLMPGVPEPSHTWVDDAPRPPEFAPPPGDIEILPVGAGGPVNPDLFSAPTMHAGANIGEDDYGLPPMRGTGQASAPRPAATSGARPVATSGARPRESTGSGARPSPQSGARPSAQSGARPAVESAARPSPQSASMPSPRSASMARPVAEAAPARPADAPAPLPPIGAAAAAAARPAPRPAAASGVAVQSASREEAPSRGGAGKALAGVAVLLLLLGGGGFGAWKAGLFGGGGATGGGGAAVPAVPAAAGTIPGGTVQVAEPAPDRGGVKLTLMPPGKAVVSIQASAGDYKVDWDGTGALVLEGLSAGTYKTKVTPNGGGSAKRSTFEVVAGQRCGFNFPLNGSGEWEKGACE